MLRGGRIVRGELPLREGESHPRNTMEAHFYDTRWEEDELANQISVKRTPCENCVLIAVFLFRLITGLPDCGSKAPWPIYHYQNSSDRLRLLPNGVLRHYFDHNVPHETEMDDINPNSLYHDYEPNKYCLEKVHFSIFHTSTDDYFILESRRSV